MAELSKEQFEQVPDFLQGEYEQNGDVYVHKLEGKVGALKGSLNSLDEKYKGTETQLQEFKSQQEEAIRQARDEALQEALTKGQKDEVNKRFQEQMDDLKTRMQSERDHAIAERDEAYGMIKTGKRDSFLSNLRNELDIFSDCRDDFDDLVGNLLDFDPKTGKATFFERGGSATSLDEKGFIDAIKQRPAVQRMMKASPSGQGGHANGNSSNSNSGGAGNDPRAKKVAEINAKFNR